MTMLKHFGRKAAPAAWILFAAGPAVAAESGPYVGADLGEALYPKGAYHWRVASGSVLSGNSLDTADFAWSLRAGYRFSRYFGLEAGYVNLGGYSGPLTDRVNAAAGHGNMSFSAKGETLAALGALPLGDWDLHLKAGVFFNDARLNVSGIDNATPFQTRETLRNIHGLLGAGAGYDIDSHWHAQFDWTHYLNVGSKVDSTGRINGPNINNLAMGISYRF
jgi:hypothetical protein